MSRLIVIKFIITVQPVRMNMTKCACTDFGIFILTEGTPDYEQR